MILVKEATEGFKMRYYGRVVSWSDNKKIGEIYCPSHRDVFLVFTKSSIPNFLYKPKALDFVEFDVQELGHHEVRVSDLMHQLTSYLTQPVIESLDTSRIDAARRKQKAGAVLDAIDSAKAVIRPKRKHQSSNGVVVFTASDTRQHQNRDKYGWELSSLAASHSPMPESLSKESQQKVLRAVEGAENTPSRKCINTDEASREGEDIFDRHLVVSGGGFGVGRVNRRR